MKKIENFLQPTSMATLYLGVIMFAMSLFLDLPNNILLFAGLVLVLAGTAGYIYSLKK